MVNLPTSLRYSYDFASQLLALEPLARCPPLVGKPYFTLQDWQAILCFSKSSCFWAQSFVSQESHPVSAPWWNTSRAFIFHPSLCTECLNACWQITFHPSELTGCSFFCNKSSWCMSWKFCVAGATWWVCLDKIHQSHSIFHPSLSPCAQPLYF